MKPSGNYQVSCIIGLLQKVLIRRRQLGVNASRTNGLYQQKTEHYRHYRHYRQKFRAELSVEAALPRSVKAT